MNLRWEEEEKEEEEEEEEEEEKEKEDNASRVQKVPSFFFSPGVVTTKYHLDPQVLLEGIICAHFLHLVKLTNKILDVKETL